MVFNTTKPKKFCQSIFAITSEPFTLNIFVKLPLPKSINVSVTLCKIMNVGAKIKFIKKLTEKAVKILPKRVSRENDGRSPEAMLALTP